MNITLPWLHTQARAELPTERITLAERLHEIKRIWTQPADEVHSTAIGYRPDETYNRREIVNGVVRWYKVTRQVK